MSDFVIYTDSGCDLEKSMLESMGVKYVEFTFHFDGEDKEYNNYDMDIKSVYDRMRKGEVAKTAAINSQSFISAFSEVLDTGADVLYIGFSSGGSTTFNSARLAIEELKKKYPNSRVEAVDTLAFSTGEGMLVYLAAQKKKSGASLDEVAGYIRETAPKLCHWFTVDDLVYLKRGGRVSPTVAFVGNLLGIKPILHVDDEGHLTSVSKVRGRKNAITALADKYTELALDPEGGTVFLCHGDCRADADLLAKELKERHGVDVVAISDIGPVIGAHSGPGTLAVFFVGKER